MFSLSNATCVFLAFIAIPDDSTPWPQFLGPTSVEIAERSIPLTWSSNKNVAWEREITGYGQSSPVVWNDTAYVTSVEGKMKENLIVSAYSIANGDKTWEQKIATKHQSENSDYFSRAAPTPVVSKLGVTVWFENGDLFTFDHGGRQLWHVDLVEMYGPIQSRHGLSSSLAQWNNMIYVWVQREQQPYLLCVDQGTGNVIWKKDLEPGTSWSSPAIIPVNDDETHLVLSAAGNGNSGKLIGIQPSTGETAWELSGLAGNTTPTPTLVKPGRVLVGASAGREGGPSKEAIATNGLVAIEKQAGSWQARYVWRSTRATCGFCSPVAHRGLAYFVDRRGRLFCLDVESGEEVFSENLEHSVWATPLAIGSRVYFVGEDGMSTVIEADRTFKKLAFNVLWKTDSSPAEENNQRNTLSRTRQYAACAISSALIIRRGDRLYCLKP
ncbi:MAG: serine/threonine protein kinase [Planctomycetes bacterium]|nr:serine/threonine protein kinase [Planctomycetota bacterium]